MRNIFFEKSNTKCGGETILRHCTKKSKLSILWIGSLKFYTVCFHCQAEGYRKILKLSCKPLHFISYKAFLKKQDEVFN